jgi:SAM-dependent methyltransferase
MSIHDEIAVANEQLWEKLVREECGYTIPWLALDPVLLRQYATGHLETVPDSLIEMYPPGMLAGVEGKEVLCLASGGGQQSAVFGLLGAQVTVVDLAEGQLVGDREAAEHYGYKVTTLKGDMRDLSRLHDDSFDLIYQGPSMCYIPDVRQVYSQVARVLRTGGVYRVDCQQPAVFSVEWNGEAYCITKPYVEKTHRREDGGIECRHTLSDIFNGLLDMGFSIEQVHEAPHYQRQDPQAEPGSWPHQETYVSGGFAIVAKKG